MDLGPTRKGLSQRIRNTMAAWKNVRPVDDGEADLIAGVRAIPAAGHSPGQVAHLVSSGTQHLLVTADVSLLPALFVRNPEWQVRLDQDPLMAVETRKRIFARAVADKLMITGTHWLLPSVGTIAKDGHGYAFTPAA
jgi:glyoxylase-like metal-dependent hydrolase (beta-lactamase superfamily II)